MMIHWQPCRDDRGRHTATYTQPEPDVLGIGADIELDMTDTSIVEYDIPEVAHRWVNRAWREAGTLHVELVAFYTKTHTGIWETKPYRGADPEDYGTQESLSWHA